MRRFIRTLVGPRGAPVTSLICLIVFGALGAFATQIAHDDDLLAFLPEGHTDVLAFREINERFGGLEVGVVGYAVDDALAPSELARLRELTQALDKRPEVGYALSLTNVQDVAPDPAGGIQRRLLVPADGIERSELQTRIAARPLIHGELVSHDFKAYALYVFAPPGSDPRTFAKVVREVAESKVNSDELRLYGAPFISSYIYETTQEDLRRLTPWAVALVVLLVIIAFRDLWGALLALVAPALGAGGALGAMALAGVPSNLVLSSMPVILFSVGSAYGIHVLARYYSVVAESGNPSEAMQETLIEVGPTVIAAGLTTIAGLLSFLAMDMAPLRTFGLFTALGLLFSLILSLTFVPAVACTLKLRVRPRGPSLVSRATADVVASVMARPAMMRVVLVAVFVFGAALAARVDARMDPKSFFADGSPPAQGEAFFAEHFGGATYLQVELTADFQQPENLHMIAELSDRMSAVSGVVSVRHVAEVVAEVNKALQGSKRVPDTAAQIRSAYGFLAGQRSVEQLVTADRQTVALMVKLGPLTLDQMDVTLREIEGRVAEATSGHWVVRRGVQALGARVRRAVAAIEAQGIRPNAEQRAELRALAAKDATPDPKVVEAYVLKFLNSEEGLVDLSEHPELRAQVAHAAVSGDKLQDRLLSLVPVDGLDGEDQQTVAEDLALSLEAPISEGSRQARVRSRSKELQGTLPTLTNAAAEQVAYIFEASALLDLGPPKEPASSLSARVSGLPVLHRALSESARNNQLSSLAVAMGLVLFVLSLRFGSLGLGFLATAPTALTLAVVYGGMGALGIHLDLGTSMLASLIIGAGVDYAVHLVAAERASTAENTMLDATRKTAPAVWTNALVVAAGFALLTTGEARPLQNVAGLTAAALLVAALTTFVTVAAWPRAKKRTQPVVALSEERP